MLCIGVIVKMMVLNIVWVECYMGWVLYVVDVVLDIMGVGYCMGVGYYGCVGCCIECCIECYVLDIVC